MRNILIKDIWLKVRVIIGRRAWGVKETSPPTPSPKRRGGKNFVLCFLREISRKKHRNNNFFPFPFREGARG